MERMFYDSRALSKVIILGVSCSSSSTNHRTKSTLLFSSWQAERTFALMDPKVCYADEVDFDAINGNGRWSRFEVVMKAESAERSLS